MINLDNDEDKFNTEGNRHKKDLLNFKHTLNITKYNSYEKKKIIDEDTIICEGLNKEITTSKNKEFVGIQEQTFDDVNRLLLPSKIKTIVRK